MTRCLDCPLGRLAVCRAIPEPERRLLLAIQSSQSLAAQETLFSEGDPALHLFTPLDGAIKLYKLMPDGRRQITGFFFPGDLFGFAAGAVHATTAEAVVPTTVCRFATNRLDQLFALSPTIERVVYRRALAKLARFHDQMLLLGRKTAAEKLATFLVSLSDRAVDRGEPASPVLIPMGRADIADYLGLTIETVSRTLTRFRAAGLVDLPNPGTVYVCAPDRLRALADGIAGL